MFNKIITNLTYVRKQGNKAFKAKLKQIKLLKEIGV